MIYFLAGMAAGSAVMLMLIAIMRNAVFADDTRERITREHFQRMHEKKKKGFR